NVIFSDPVEWMNQQWLDYLTPQLYWAFGGGQDYAKLAPWWESVRNERHLYPGHGLYRSDRNTFTGTLFGASEVPNQVRFNRTHGGIDGSVFFRARNITTFQSMGFADSLKVDLHRHPALVPTMDWRDSSLPDSPENVSFEWTDAGEVTISWDPPAPAEGVPAPRRFAVYRIRSAGVPNFPFAIEVPSNLIAVTGETAIKDYPEVATDPYYYVVTSVSMNSVESFESDYVMLEGRAVSTEDVTPLGSFNVSQNYPNPFAEQTSIIVETSLSANLFGYVYDAVGRRVATFADGVSVVPGEHILTWDGRDDSGSRVASGTYFYTVEAAGRRVTRPMVVVR
ncbi:MAG: FlgD immunoglobulin-like domain containing protein, partial [Rhodothermales bacterium]|nr:FlgD immunoglobulin-like domain containing protein [Rhodothermales bacterium]